ncbi:MAG: sorbosone dehydrogenase family protein [Gemmatimonadaceae bacterium]|uniref:PQQ-dependent sugar dehydrogenase n=1 Tax=Caulobacter sp. DWP3-1-3b2 TaxID=2804643 RepID=UPI0019A96CDC|nr:sorbosone dehydrogenase family protein [Caulobacter sp.]
MTKALSKTYRAALIGAPAVLLLSACGGGPALPTDQGYGANPTLPAAKKQAFPVMKIAPAVGWANGQTPDAAPGFVVTALVRDLDHPRWLYVLPNGDVLIAETNAPPKPEDGKGIRGFVQKIVMGRAGATVPSANRITLVRDANNDGTPEVRTVFLANLSSPFGMALVGDTFYVADSDALLAFPYQAGQTQITTAPRKVVDLPAGPINHHWTKNVIASPDGSKLYVTVGSNSNVGENGMAAEERRAGILEIDPATGASRVFASGLRNPNGMAWQPQSGKLWTSVNERDEIGNDLVPDYMTSVQDGGFYGWPYSYYGQTVDARVKPRRPDLVARAIKPDYALGAHTASLGLTFYDASAFPARYKGGAFIGQHGSWNRKPVNGYKVTFVPFANGMPSGKPEDFLTGFLNAQGEALGRPVGVAIEKSGALLVADDVGNVIWRVTATKNTPGAKPAP